MNHYAIGIDIGGTNTVVGLVNAEGKVVSREALKTQDYFKGDVFIEDIISVIRRILKDNGVSEVEGIGIGAPNANYVTGQIEANTANLRIKECIPMCDAIGRALNTTTVLSNDADAAALGERIYGGAKECDNFVMVTLGTGVGSGFFADGRIVHGQNCMAGELGHITIFPDGRECTCGRRGCLETYTSARGICQTFKELAAQHPDNIPSNIDLGNITSRDVGMLANEGNAIAIETFNRTAKILAIGLANAAAFSNPAKIFLMGGPTKVGAPLLDPLKRYFKEQLLFIYKDRVEIELSQLDDNDAAILGAAALVHLKK